MEQRRGSPQFALPLMVLAICCAFPEGGGESVCETTPLSVLDCAMQGAVHKDERVASACLQAIPPYHF